MKTWFDIIFETKQFVITRPTAGKMNIWAATKSGNKSRSANGWDILNNIVKIIKGDCPKFNVYKDHVECKQRIKEVTMNKHMTVSKLIKVLSEMQAEHGDLEISVNAQECGTYSLYSEDVKLAHCYNRFGNEIPIIVIG